MWSKDVQEKAHPSLEFPKFPIFRQLRSIQKYIYTWSLQKIWMFWKAMSLNRSFLLSKSRGPRLWYPLVPILREGFLGNFSLIFCSVLTQSFSIFFIYPSEGYPMYLPITKNTGNRRLISHLSSPENLRSIHQETKKLGRITFWGELRSPPIPAGLRPSTLREG